MAARTRTMRSIRADRRPPGRPEIGPTMMPSAADRLQERSPEPAACRPRRRRLGRALTGSLIAALTLAATGCATELPSRPESPPEVLLLPDRSRDARTPADWEAVSRKALPSVVALRIDHGLTKSAGDWGAAIFDSFKLMFRNPIGGLLDFLGNLFIGWIDLVTVEGTGFVLTKDGLVLTNAHVVKGMLAMPEAVVIQNDTGKIFKIKRMKYHPSFTTPQSPDVALIEIETGGAKLPALPLADTTKLQNLRIGTHLGTMGYPGELQAAYLSSIDPRTRTVKSALATFKDGWIGRMTNYRLERDDFDKRTFLQHSASLSGGTSGSPMFTADGTVVALNNAGLDLYVVVKKGKETGVKRAANAAEIGYAIRVDELRKFMQSTGW